jgi:hypothetical protein
VPSRNSASLALVAAAVIVVAGCGSSESPSDKARSVVRRLYVDLTSGEGAAACSLLTSATRREVVRPLKRFGDAHRRIDCRTFLGAISEAASKDPAVLGELRTTRIGAASVSGDHATVLVRGPSNRVGGIPLIKTTAGWEISKLYIFQFSKPLED